MILQYSHTLLAIVTGLCLFSCSSAGTEQRPVTATPSTEMSDKLLVAETQEAAADLEATCKGIVFRQMHHNPAIPPQIEIGQKWDKALEDCIKPEWVSGTLGVGNLDSGARRYVLSIAADLETLYWSPRSEEEIGWVVALPRLSALIVDDPGEAVVDRIIPSLVYRKLKKLSSLRNLTIVALMTNEELGALSELSQLDTLKIDRLLKASGDVDLFHLNEVGASHLGKLTSLQHLTVPGPIGDAEIAQLSDMKELKRLETGFGTTMSDRGVKSLGSLTSLKLSELYLLGTQATGGGLSQASFSQLESLNLAESKVSDSSLAKLSSLQNLKSLNLSYTKITSAGLAQLGKIKQLSNIDLIKTSVGNTGWKQLSSLPISSLKLSGTKIGDSALREIGKYGQLTHLNLSDTKIGNRGLKHLAGLRQMSNLNLRSTQISNAGLKHLGAMGQIEILNLRFTQVGNAGIANLGSLKVGMLVIRNTKVSDDGLVHIPDSVKYLVTTKGQFSNAALVALEKRIPGIQVIGRAK